MAWMPFAGSFEARTEAPSIVVIKDVDDGGGATEFQTGSTVSYSVLILHEASSSEGITEVVLTDALPEGTTASATDFTVDYGSTSGRPR